MRNILIVCILFVISSFEVIKSQSCYDIMYSDFFGDYYYNEIELTCPDNPINFGLVCGEWYNININNGSGTNIVVRIEVGHLEPGVSLGLYINGQSKSLNLEDGETYVYRTTNGSGNAMIELMTESMDECSGNISDITITYYPITSCEYLHPEDEYYYVKRIIDANKTKYLNQPISVLFDDMNTYKVCIQSFIRISREANRFTYDAVDFTSVPLYKIIPYIGDNLNTFIIKINLDKPYLESEYDQIEYDCASWSEPQQGWNYKYKNVIKTKLISEIRVQLY